MKALYGAAAMAAILTATASIVAPPATAAVGISVNFGDVAIGYQDGYYDRDHHWHPWAHSYDYKAFRNAHPEHYRDYRHDRDEHEHPH